MDRETAPGNLDGRGVLTIRVSSPGWAAQVRFLSNQVILNANEALGRDIVREVRVSIDLGLAPAGEGSKRPSERPESTP